MKRRILLIEDDAALRMLYEDELGEEGYEVLSARDGKEGIRRYEQERPDLVVLDIVMPLMDGLEALSRLRRENGKVPVILHTPHDKYLEDARVSLADAVIMKGNDLGGLKKKINDLLE